jgi:hypothetical protein
MPTVYTEVEVDVSLEDFDDYDLIDELNRRGRSLEVSGTSGTELVEAIYQKRRLGQSFDRELDQLIYAVTGKIV